MQTLQTFLLEATKRGKLELVEALIPLVRDIRCKDGQVMHEGPEIVLLTTAVPTSEHLLIELKAFTANAHRLWRAVSMTKSDLFSDSLLPFPSTIQPSNNSAKSLDLTRPVGHRIRLPFTILLNMGARQ